MNDLGALLSYSHLEVLMMTCRLLQWCFASQASMMLSHLFIVIYAIFLHNFYLKDQDSMPPMMQKKNGEKNSCFTDIPLSSNSSLTNVLYHVRKLLGGGSKMQNGATKHA